jgi:hypothetical protein
MLRTYLLLLPVIALALITACRSTQYLPDGSDTRPFDSAQWLDPHSSDYLAGKVSVREEMLADLVKNVLRGKSREDIEKLLGPSLHTPYFRSVNKDLIYYLGPERDSIFGNIDSEWLLIWLDSTGHFKKYGIYND